MKRIGIIIIVVIIGYLAWYGYEAKQEANLAQSKIAAYNQCMVAVNNTRAWDHQRICAMEGEQANCNLNIKEINSENKWYNGEENNCRRW